MKPITIEPSNYALVLSRSEARLHARCLGLPPETDMNGHVFLGATIVVVDPVWPRTNDAQHPD